jgi:hypothetical protein
MSTPLHFRFFFLLDSENGDGRGNFPFAWYGKTGKTCSNWADDELAPLHASASRLDDTCPRQHVQITPLLVPSACTIKAFLEQDR